MRKYYLCGIKIYQITENNGIFYLYKMKEPSSIISEWNAWEFISRHDSLEECQRELMYRVCLGDILRLPSMEISEENVLLTISQYKFSNLRKI